MSSLQLAWQNVTEQPLLIRVSHGQLQSVFCGGAIGTEAVALIAHPHPLHGGTMGNKVVTTVARACRELGLPHMRYNSRGTGDSTGQFDNGLGETEDLLAIIKQLRDAQPNVTIFLIGFSFGAYVAYRAACQFPQHQGLLTIAPAVTSGDFTEFEAVPEPWQIFVAGDDEVVAVSAIKDWYQGVSPAPGWRYFDEASHFFHGRLLELRDAVVAVISTWLSDDINHARLSGE